MWGRAPRPSKLPQSWDTGPDRLAYLQKLLITSCLCHRVQVWRWNTKFLECLCKRTCVYSRMTAMNAVEDAPTSSAGICKCLCLCVPVLTPLQARARLHPPSTFPLARKYELETAIAERSRFLTPPQAHARLHPPWTFPLAQNMYWQQI